jgi:CRP/FNR family nitrogen fixation transcriptional regulator
MLKKGERLFSEGDRAAHFHVVTAGAVRTFKLLSDGRRQIDAFHLPGDTFGVETGEEHRFSAEAAADTVVITYRRSALQSLAESGGSFAQDTLESLVRALERAQEHMLLLGRKSAMEKIAAFLLSMAERTHAEALALPMCRSDIADHLGLTIETVSRSLTQLERQGVIALPAGRRTIVLKDLAALRRLDA